MQLVDFPRQLNLSDYESAISQTLGFLSQQPGLVSVLQVGSVSLPGISDVDLVAIFEDDADMKADPLALLDSNGRYIFVHSQFATSRSHMLEAQRFQFFHDFECLWGEDLTPPASPLTEEESSTVDAQVGLEYLTKMFVSMSIARTYGISQVRGLLLLVKGLTIDLDYLGIKDGPLIDLLRQAIGWREIWFKSPPSKREFRLWVDSFFNELESVLSAYLSGHSLYVPDWVEPQLARNVVLFNSARLEARRSGVSLPSVFGFLGRKYFNIQHRFNSFEFGLPMTTVPAMPVLTERHELIARMREHNSVHLPRLAPLGSSLGIFSRASQGRVS